MSMSYRSAYAKDCGELKISKKIGCFALSLHIGLNASALFGADLLTFTSFACSLIDTH